MADLEMYRILVESFEILSKHRHIQFNQEKEEKEEPDAETMQEITKYIKTPTNVHAVNLAQMRSDSQRLITFEEKRQRQKKMYNKIKENAMIQEIEIVEYESDFEDGFGIINAAKLKAEHFESIPLKQTLKRQRSEQEVIGNMRYIYDIDENDNRVLVRRKSLSKMSGVGYSLQGK